MTIAREDVDDGSRVDRLELFDGLMVEDMIRSGFNDGQFSLSSDGLLATRHLQILVN